MTKCYHYCGCKVDKQCGYCNSDFPLYFNMQRNEYTKEFIYPKIKNATNTNGQSCSFDTEYVDVIDKRIFIEKESFIFTVMDGKRKT